VALDLDVGLFGAGHLHRRLILVGDVTQFTRIRLNLAQTDSRVGAAAL